MTSDNPPQPDRDRVIIYTDGAAEPNPGPGGYGAVLMAGKHRKELSGGFRKTTNNRMELMAVIVALESLKRPCRVLLYSDSKYVVESVTRGSVFRWQKKNWFRTGTERAKNSDLWERFLIAFKKHQVEFRWVKGHAGVPENERCDELAVAAIQSADLEDDVGFENPTIQKPALAFPTHSPASDTTAAEQATPADSEPIKNHEKEGEPCRKCRTPLVKKPTKKHPPKPGQTYRYDWYLHCPGCNTMYMVEAAKRML
jgi:ribonuclease HI